MARIHKRKPGDPEGDAAVVALKPPDLHGDLRLWPGIAKSSPHRGSGEAKRFSDRLEFCAGALSQ